MDNGEHKTNGFKIENESDDFDEISSRSRVIYMPCEIETFGGSGKNNDSRSEQNLIDHISASVEYEKQYKSDICGAIQLNDDDIHFMDLSPNEVKAEEIKIEGDIDIHYDDVKIGIIDKEPGECEVCNKDVVSETRFSIEFPRDCSCHRKIASNISSIQGMDMTQDVKQSLLCRSRLEAHERNHAVEKPFHCKNCFKAFAKLRYLKDHERIHTGKKSYICKNCSKAFTRSSHLKAHAWIHTGKKPYVCANCSRTYATSSHLRRHERIHTGQKSYICRNCSKAFTDSSSLKVHERIHTGEKPFHCQICTKAFVTSSNLRQHENIHTRQKQYVCKYCSKAFVTSSNLKRHERIHTGKK